MSKRTVLAIATLALFCSFGTPSWAADAPAKGKHSAQHEACADHVKKMKGMKTSAERDTYCKGDSACSSNHCEADDDAPREGQAPRGRPGGDDGAEDHQLAVRTFRAVRCRGGSRRP